MRDLHLHLLIPLVGLLPLSACQSDDQAPRNNDEPGDGDGDDDEGNTGGVGTGGATTGGSNGTGGAATGGSNGMGGGGGIPDTGECATTDELSVHCVATNYCTAYQACDPADFASEWSSFAECFDDTEEETSDSLDAEGYDENDPDVAACFDSYRTYLLCVQQVVITSCDVWADDYVGEPGSDAYECYLAYDAIYETCSALD